MISNVFSAGTSFRERGRSFVVIGCQASSRKLRDQETGETILQSVKSLMLRYKANEIELEDLLSPGREPRMRPESPIERCLADYSEERQTETKVKLYYLMTVCPHGRMLVPKRDLKAALENAHAEFSLKRPDLPKPDKPPAVSTVYKWLKEWRASSFSAARLVNRYDLSGRRPAPIGEELAPLIELCIDRFFASNARPSISAALEHLQGQVIQRNLVRPPGDQLPLPTRRQIVLVLGRQDRYELLLKRYGKAVAERLTRIHKTKPPTERPLERVEVDHTPLDLICLTDDGVFLGRPYLTVLIDVHSRMILAAWISFRYPNTEVVLRALKQAILPKDELLKAYGIKGEWPAWGVPYELVLDNGKEFHSNALEAAALDLGIQIIYCPPRQPWFKGVVERYLKEINYSFIQLQPGATFAKYFLRGEYDADKHAAITLTDLQRLIYRWIVEVYHRKFHSGLMDCPLERWNKSVKEHGGQVLPRSPEALDVYLSMPEQRRLSAKGIEANSKLFYTCPELESLRLRKGDQTLTVRRNPDDVSYVHFLHPETNTYVKAFCTLSGYGNGMSLERHQACRKHAWEIYKSLPHRDAMLAAKAELIEEGLRIKENHAAFLQRLKRHECKQKRSGAGDEKAKWSRQVDPAKDQPNRKGPRKDRSGVQLQARTEMVKVDRSPQKRAAAPAEPLLTFEGLTPFSADQSTLF